MIRKPCAPLGRPLSSPVLSPPRAEPECPRQARPPKESGQSRRTTEPTRTRLPSQLDNAGGVAAPVGIPLWHRAAFPFGFYWASTERDKIIQKVRHGCA